MQMESNGHGNHHYFKYGQFSNGNNSHDYYDHDHDYDDDDDDGQLLGFYNGNSNHKSNGNRNGKGKGRITMMPCNGTTSSPSTSSTFGGSGVGVGFIEHPVSRLDTLAGVAIKYGVEVADIKRLNGLVTDLQMFALKSLQIPLPGRHPPSPCLSNGLDALGYSSSEHTPSRCIQSNLFDSFQSLKTKPSNRKVSPAMSSLQGYYGLNPTDQKFKSGGFEMAVYRKGMSHYLEDGPYVNPLPASHLPLSIHRKTKSLVNGFLDENNGLDKLFLAEAKESDSEKLVRRRQKSETDFTSKYSNLLIREENSGGAFSSIRGKGLALRPNAQSRTTTDAEAGGLTSVPSQGDLADGFLAVRKSSSTPSLNDQDSCSSLWPTSKWSLKPDLQVLSAATITRPIFDGLPKPITSRKNKAALD